MKVSDNEIFFGGNLLPPLGQSDLNLYFEKMKSGDKDAREIIINHNIKLVIYRVLNHFQNAPYDKSELVSIGLIGLIKSVDTFDLSKNIKFSVYAGKCIDNEINMFLRREKKHIKDVSFDKIISVDKKGNTISLKDVLSDENSDFVLDYENKEVNVIVRQLVEELPPRDKEIVSLYFGFFGITPLSQIEIAERFGISKSYMSRLISKVLCNLKNQLKKCEIIESTSSEIIEYSNLLKCTDKKRGKDKMPRKVKSIYEYLNEYKREEIDEVLSNLKEEEKNLIRLRYGDDLDNPVKNPEWTNWHHEKLYGSLLPKIKRSLAKKRQRSYYRSDVNSKQLEQKTTSVKDTLEEPIINFYNNNSMVKEDYIKILELLKNPFFEQLKLVLPPKDAVIFALKFGYVDGKYYTTESIADFLGITELDVNSSIKNVLLTYKEKVNQLIDTAIDVATDKPVVLKLK